MVEIFINSEISKTCSDVTLGCISCNVEIKAHVPLLWEKIDEEIETIRRKLPLEEISKLEAIASSKKAYRQLGKDPNRYRLSAESLLRRIANGKGLYRINNVVDLLNLVSIKSGFSIGGYNEEKIQGTVNFGKGQPDEIYEGIGRGKLNIENLPIFRDHQGAFGSPTSDSIRTQIDNNCQRFLMIIISFQKDKELATAIDLATELLKQYANATNIETKIVTP